MIKIVVVDLKPCLDKYVSNAKLYDIFKVMTLQHIVSAILDDRPGYLDVLVDEIKTEDNLIDDMFIDNFYDCVFEDLIAHLYTHTSAIDNTIMKLLEWVDQTSVVLAYMDDGDEQEFYDRICRYHDEQRVVC